MDKACVLITGADGKIGKALTARLSDRYEIIGSDLDDSHGSIACDLSDPASVSSMVTQVTSASGGRIASVVHLAGYYDFTGRDDPMYREVNERGTLNLLDALGQADLAVEQFLYAGTMLIHEAGDPGERIDEAAPIRPGWAYPESKARTEEIIEDEAPGGMRTLRLHLAGLYDDTTAVPTLAHQIARIYERGPMARLYAGDLSAGQALIHLEDMLDAFEAAIDRRQNIPDDTVILVGEEKALSFDAIQERLGELLHGESNWRTWSL
ncbi:MAG: NAD-dependent epimerase/dehydratase family protein, partial [Shimia sp.]